MRVELDQLALWGTLAAIALTLWLDWTALTLVVLFAGGGAYIALALAGRVSPANSTRGARRGGGRVLCPVCGRPIRGTGWTRVRGTVVHFSCRDQFMEG